MGKIALKKAKTVKDCPKGPKISIIASDQSI